MIGGAGYAFPQEYLKTYPLARMTVVEIDPGMTDIARNLFRLKDDPRLSIEHADGRVFLNSAGSGSYDAILMDAFGTLFSVPYQLTTKEAATQISRVLDDRGVVIFNLGSAIAGDSSRLLHAELSTYREVFPSVHVFKVNTDYTDEQVQNVMIVACKTPCLESPSTTSDQEIADLLSHRRTIDPVASIPVLTDDLAPVEYYNSFGQNSFHR
jgi:spermidine synthase